MGAGLRDSWPVLAVESASAQPACSWEYSKDIGPAGDLGPGEELVEATLLESCQQNVIHMAAVLLVPQPGSLGTAT